MTGLKKLFSWNLFKKPSQSLRFRITYWFIIIGSVPTIAVGIFALHQQTQVLKSKAFQSQKRILSQKLDGLQTYLNENRRDIKEVSGRFTLQNLIEAIPTGDKEKIEFWLEPVQEDFARLANIRKRYFKIQLIDLKGQEIIRVDYENNRSRINPKNKLKSVRARPLFKTISNVPIDHVHVVPLMAFDSESGKKAFSEPVVQFGSPLFSPAGKKIGFLIFTARAGPILKSFGNVPMGKIMLVDASGYFLNHSDLKKQDGWKTLQADEKFQDHYTHSLFQKLKENSKGIIEDHSTEFLSFQKINYDPGNFDRVWFGIYSRNKDQVLQPVTKFKNQFALIIILVLVSIIIAAGIFGRNLTEPLHKVVSVAKAVTDGDLRQEKLNSQSEDEIGVLAKAFNAMVDTLRKNIHSISGTSSTLNASSIEISTAVNEQSTIATQQSASLNEITATLEELSNSSSQIANNAHAVFQYSSDALIMSQKGANTIENLKEKIDGILEDNKINIKDIINLGNKSKEIGKVMEIINNIADQTKLIAFNAAIEASGAGEAGKRFWCRRSGNP